MRFITYIENGKYIPAVLSKNGKHAKPFSALGIKYASVLDAVKANAAFEITDFDDGFEVSHLKLTAPIPFPSQDIICLGINYLAHAEESARYKKEAFEREREYPVYFSKRATEAVGTGSSISLHKNLTERVDYESELAFVISKDALNVKREDAYSYVYGYTVINDVSARDVQTRHKQWYFGKSLDGFTSMGPCIVTGDEIGNPENLFVKSYVNGELRQNSNTSLMVFDIPHVIEELSSGMTLKAGTIVSMGTPAGVGMGFDPPKFLKDGDEVICEVENIGKLANTFTE